MNGAVRLARQMVDMALEGRARPAQVTENGDERASSGRGSSVGGSRFVGVVVPGWSVARTTALVLMVAVPIAVRWAPGISSASDGAVLSQADATFVTRAVGSVPHEAPLHDKPEGGSVLGTVPAGSLVDVGGVVPGRSGIWPRDMYWVRVTTSAGARQGFVRARDVALTAGVPPTLSVSVDHGSLFFDLDGLMSDGAWNASSIQSLVDDAARADDDGSDDVSIVWLPDTVAQWSDAIVAAAARHGVDPELLAIIVLVESGGDPRAGSHAGARGLTQVMPATGTSIAAERGIASFAPEHLWQPEIALDFGAYYIAQQLRAFGRVDDPDWQQSVELAAAAYNGGPGTAMSGRYPAETTAYVRWVGGMWRERNSASSNTFGAWMSAGGQHLVDAARQRMVYRGGGSAS